MEPRCGRRHCPSLGSQTMGGLIDLQMGMVLYDVWSFRKRVILCTVCRSYSVDEYCMFLPLKSSGLSLREGARFVSVSSWLFWVRLWNNNDTSASLLLFPSQVMVGIERKVCFDSGVCVVWWLVSWRVPATWALPCGNSQNKVSKHMANSSGGGR